MRKSLVWFDWILHAFIAFAAVFCYTLAVLSLDAYFRHGDQDLSSGIISVCMAAFNVFLFLSRFWQTAKLHTLVEWHARIEKCLAELRKIQPERK